MPTTATVESSTCVATFRVCTNAPGRRLSTSRINSGPSAVATWSKSLVPTEEMIAKIKASVDSRHDADFIVIARTDAYSVEGYDAALERAARYIEAGADMIFVEELRTVEQLAEVPRRFKVPALDNMASSGKTPFLAAEEIEQLGFRVVIYPNLIMRAQIHAAQTVLRALKSTGDMNPCSTSCLDGERYELLRLPEIQAFEARYGVDGKASCRSGVQTTADPDREDLDAHTIVEEGGQSLLYVDWLICSESASMHAFNILHGEGVHVRRPSQVFGVVDHYSASTGPRLEDVADGNVATS